jgi:hypothetical protein
MKVEIFYREKDDNFRASYRVIKNIIEEFKKKYTFKLLEVQLIQIEKKDVEKYKFSGHITVRINGQDIEERNDNNYTIEDRYYEEDNKKVNYIPKKVFEKAVKNYIDSSITAQEMKGEEPDKIC